MSDPIEAVEQFLLWFRWGMMAVGVAALGVGLLSAMAPRRSIALYQWIMRQFNWRVTPIDEARELRNTRLLGLLLIGLGLVDFWMVCDGRMSMMSAEGAMTTKAATVAGGCFWCMEGPFEHLPGVISVTAGYTGGTKADPTYDEVSSGATGHAEAVQILYDPSKVSYETLLEVFWRNIDPTQVDGQFADHGRQYRTAVFYHDEEQKRLAEASKAQLAAAGTFDKPIVTEIVPASTFYPAEDYHQDYYKKNPLRYKLYRVGSGREGYLKKTWGQ